MADESNRGKLTDDEKAQTRAAVAEYKRDHPEANLKEIRANLDLPFKDKITEGVLRGLAARRKDGAGRTRGGRRAAAAEARPGARPGRRARNRTLERLIADLKDLRQRRDALDAEIDDLESELGDRLRADLGADHAGRIFGNLLDHGAPANGANG